MLLPYTNRALHREAQAGGKVLKWLTLSLSTVLVTKKIAGLKLTSQQVLDFQIIQKTGQILIQKVISEEKKKKSPR